MNKTFDDNEFLWSQFIRLGEMLGDGDCDAWVSKEYKRIAKRIGLIKRKPRKKQF